MPFYEYQCKDCKHQEEVHQSIKDEPLIKCPKCKKETFVRVITATNFALSGEGWHKTDYKK